MSTQNANLASFIADQAKVTSVVQVHGKTDRLEKIATHAWREELLVNRAWAFASVQRQREQLNEGEKNVARDVLLATQSWCLEALPRDFDSKNRADRKYYIDTNKVVGALSTELLNLAKAMILGSGGAFTQKMTEKGSAWYTYVSKVESALALGYNPARIDPVTGSLKFAYLSDYLSDVKKQEAAHKEAEKAEQQAKVALADSFTPAGKLANYKLKAVEWFKEIVERAESIEQLDSVFIGNNLVGSVLKQLRNLDNTVDDAQVNSLKAQFEAMRKAAVEPDLAPTNVATPGDTSDEKVAYNQGHDCYMNDGALDDCPYDEGVMRDQWRTGYKAAREVIEG